MRILHLLSYPLYSGPLPGTLALAIAQRRLGHTVWLAADSQRGNFDGFEEAAEPHLDGAQLSPPLSKPLALSTRASMRQHWADIRALRQFLRPNRVQIVHTHLSHDHVLAALCRSARVPLVRTVHAARALSRRFGQRFLLQRADHLIVRSQAHKNRLLALLAVPAEQTTSIPGSVDVAMWQQPDAKTKQRARQRFRQEHGICQSAPLLGHVALIAGRGQQALLAALSMVATPASSLLHVVFVGDGSHAQALKAEVAQRRLGHRVHFTGYLPAPRLKDAYAAMDAAYVMQAGNDAAVRAALEAMAAGLPVLAPNTDALGELVDARTGFVLRANAADAVAEGIDAWLQQSDAGQARGVIGAARVRRERGIQTEALATLGVYDKCLAPLNGCTIAES